MNKEIFWNVVSVKGRCEKKVKSLLDREIASRGLANEIAVIAPDFVRGYIFICSSKPLTSKSVYMISQTSGVLCAPMATTVAEMDAFFAANSGVKKASCSLKAGSAVSIVAGPFCQMNGVVESVNADNSLVIRVFIFGRHTAISVKPDEVVAA